MRSDPTLRPLQSILLHSLDGMARIMLQRRSRQTYVRISGRLRASDMGRLERACAEVLTRHPLRLVVDLRAVTELDNTASAVLARLTDRGATLWRGDAGITA